MAEEGTFDVGDQTIKAHPVSFLFAPRSPPRLYRRLRASEVVCVSPAGFEDRIREMGEPARELTIPPQPEALPSEAEIQQIAARYGGEILGPQPGQ